MSRSSPRPAAGLLLLAAGLLVAAVAAARASDLPVGGAVAAIASRDQRPVAIRVHWGGGKPQAWAGTIGVTVGGVVVGVPWRTLCTAPDAAATVHEAAGAIAVHEPRAGSANGVELSIDDWRRARIQVRLRSVAGGQAETAVDVAVSELLVSAVQQPLDGAGNRLVIGQAAGDQLRVVIGDAAEAIDRGHLAAGSQASQTAVRRPGERVRLRVDPLVPTRAERSSRFELRVRLGGVARGDAAEAQTVPLTPLLAGREAVAEGRLTRFEPVELEVTLPAREGGCEVVLEAVEIGSLRWARTLASRTVQLVAVAERTEEPAAAEWKIVHEVDPASPRLHERLRRFSDAGLSQVTAALPSMPLPTFTRPNVTLPNVPLPKLPSVPLPQLPNVPLPPVATMVPRLSGLLAAGHSTVEPHGLGAMFVLPPARAGGEPTWEGIVVAGVQPGLPHVVEIEYPSDQDAIVGTSVLELSPGGKGVAVRHAGGFEVRVDPYRPTVELRRHRFVFWPTTKNPLVVVANPSAIRPATLGKMRVLAGPLRLPAAGRPAADAVGRRRTYGFLPSPDLTTWGGVERLDDATGREFADWGTWLDAIRHGAECLASRGADGGLVTVYAQGAALWPSALSRQAPRWGSGAGPAEGFDPAAKDVLGLVCHVYAAAGLRLVPGMAFDAPLPELEAVLATGGPLAEGIVCLGRDGRPLRTRHGPHYNVLDPRVQAAVERQVRELAGRLRGAPAVDGVALVMAHDGWLHLPGVATALDDATFARFLESVGTREPAAAADRFARRAELVEGPLRDLWLEWRADVVAAFHSRLAGAVAEHDPRLSLHLVPTTLFTSGELAARFRPRLGSDPPGGDVLREAGLDPLRSTAHPLVVFSTPHVHAADEDIVARGLLAAANRHLALADAVRAARRRGVAVVEQSVAWDAASIVSHGPFGPATAEGPCPIHALPTGAEAGRALAESLAAADAEVVFDMRLPLGDRPPVAARRFAALPPGPSAAAAGMPPPVVLRLQRSGGTTWVRLVNAAAAAGQVRIGLEGRPAAVLDGFDRSRLELAADGVATVPVGPWEVRTLLVDGGVEVRSARIEYDESVAAVVAARVHDLRRRRATLETPVPLELLDNPRFELGGGEAVPGWELVEQRRGTLELAAGRADAQAVDAGQSLAFTSANGLASLRSNPFPPPATGRVSVSAWLRLRSGDPQPPLRIALEAVHAGREYYRFAAVGGLAGGRPLTDQWAHFVLPVDDLPTGDLESLRVRFDLLGPGAVLIDDVQVFDLAFEESQRVQLSRMIARLEQALLTRDVGGCVVGLDEHWPRFLAAFVSDAAVARMAAVPPAAAAAPQQFRPPPPATMLDRLRRWWQ